MSKILSGFPAAAVISQTVSAQVALLTIKPVLAILVVGQHEPSLVYVRRKQLMAERLGMTVVVEQRPDSSTVEDLIEVIESWNTNPDITAILVQMPLPAAVDSQILLQKIDPNKDVDGLHPLNLGLLVANRPRLVPATARGIMTLLKHYNINLIGKQVVVIGRSRLVGKPTALLLSQAGATVTIAHRQTKNLQSVIKRADIIISAAGQPELIKPEDVRPEAIIVDVGITRLKEGLYGDASLVHQAESVEAISPVPGGVGPLTVASLMENVIICYQLQHEQDGLTAQ